MRTLSFIFVLIFAVGVSAQSTAVVKPFREGTKFANSDEFEKALSFYQSALEAAKSERIGNDFLGRLHYNLGVCSYRLHRLEKSVEYLGMAISMRKGDYSAAYYALGMAETARENWPQARLAFLGALKGNRTNGEAWFDLASVYILEKNFAGAELAFRNSVAYKSIDSPLSHNNIGVILAMKKDFAAAETEFETALEQSGGRLIEARKNLEYCRMRNRELIAKLEFDYNNKKLWIKF